MKLYVHLTAVTAVLALGLWGCSETLHPSQPDSSSGTKTLVLLRDGGGDEPLVLRLIANRRIEAGTVTVSNDPSQLCVDLATAGDWYMACTQVAYGRSLRDLPLTRKGNFQLGHFPLEESYDPAVRSSTHCFDWIEEGFVPGDTLFLAVHAELQLGNAGASMFRRASAWAEGSTVHKKNWAMYFTYVLKPEQAPEPCTLELLWPNGYENMCLYDVEVIEWVSTGGCADVVKLELFQDGFFCHLIAEEAPNTGQFEWEFAESCEGDMSGYTVRVSDPVGGSWDESDAPFTIEDCGGGGGEGW